MAQFGRALGSGPRGRQFKSVRPDHYKDMAQKRVHAFYSGRVQGVGFRYTAEAVAQNLGITGWVSNLRDGRVELLVEGEEAGLKDFLKRISEEMSVYIKDADISWEEPIGEFGDFGIRFPDPE